MFRNLLNTVVWNHAYTMGKMYGDLMLIRFKGKYIEKDYEMELNKRLKLFKESKTINPSPEFLDGFEQGYWIIFENQNI